jgi:acetyl esterase/lipase
MKHLVVSFLLLIALCPLAAQAVWQPSPGHTQIPIWPGEAPDPQPVKGPEDMGSDPKFLIAGKPVVGVNNVTRPTMTVYSPIGVNTGAAVVVFPGGGYQTLAIDLEGTEVCDWLAPKGITCVLLKYRVTDTGAYPKSGPYPESPMALEDAQRTLGLLRLHAVELHIDPHKVGVLGFSAGGHLVVAMTNHFEKRIYPPIDNADRESCRPDFGIALYPGHLSRAGSEEDAREGKTKFPLPPRDKLSMADDNLGVNPDLRPTSQTPPTFLLQAEDDHIDSVYDALSYYIALKTAGVPAEIHLYAQGNHAFGLRHTQLPITDWPQLVERWLRTIGITSE